MQHPYIVMTVDLKSQLIRCHYTEKTMTWLYSWAFTHIRMFSFRGALLLFLLSNFPKHLMGGEKSIQTLLDNAVSRKKNRCALLLRNKGKEVKAPPWTWRWRCHWCRGRKRILLPPKPANPDPPWLGWWSNSRHLALWMWSHGYLRTNTNRAITL